MKTTNTVNYQVEQIMKRLVVQDKLSAKQDSAHEFTSLVFLLRKMSQKRMKEVWEKYFDCTTSGVCGSYDIDIRDVFR